MGGPKFLFRLVYQGFPWLDSLDAQVANRSKVQHKVRKKYQLQHPCTPFERTALAALDL